jgi:hypothetical protein
MDYNPGFHDDDGGGQIAVQLRNEQLLMAQAHAGNQQGLFAGAAGRNTLTKLLMHHGAQRVVAQQQVQQRGRGANLHDADHRGDFSAKAHHDFATHTQPASTQHPQHAHHAHHVHEEAKPTLSGSEGSSGPPMFPGQAVEFPKMSSTTSARSRWGLYKLNAVNPCLERRLVSTLHEAYEVRTGFKLCNLCRCKRLVSTLEPIK